MKNKSIALILLFSFASFSHDSQTAPAEKKQESSTSYFAIGTFTIATIGGAFLLVRALNPRFHQGPTKAHLQAEHDPTHSHQLARLVAHAPELDAPPPRVTQVIQNLGLSPRNLEGVRVLVAEDDPLQSRIIRARLEQLSAHVQVVGTAEEAVQEALTGGYDAVLMDNQMPVTPRGRMSPQAGLKAVLRIRSASNPEQPIPMLMHSSNSISPEVLAEFGADGEIVKGPSKKELYVERILDAVGKKIP